MADKKFNNLVQRLITGILGSAVVITSVCYSWGYFAVFFLLCFFSLIEFYKVSRKAGFYPQQFVGIFSGILLFVLSFFIEKNWLSSKFYLLVFVPLSLVYIIKLYRPAERHPFTNIAFTFLGIFYTTVPIILLNMAAFDDNGIYNYQIILGFLLILWSTDSGAYFAGTFFGRRKLFERVSPKKSWEGFAGGAILAMIFAYGISLFFTSLAQWQWICVGWIIIIGGTYGDLVESLLKRSIEIKDSGTSLPGHGGFLDRFDGLFISAPFVVAFLELIKF